MWYIIVWLALFGQLEFAEGFGHALLFHNNKILKKGFQQFPSTALTFEAWISSSYYCYPNAIFSYALDSKESDENLRNRDFNHFVVFDTKNVIACVDYPQLIRSYDPYKQSCISNYGENKTANFVSRDGAWHHLAVTWTKDGGYTKIYYDGLLVSTVQEHDARELQSDGAFMLGAEQDCYGGCIDTYQGFYGLMDEVRLWNVERTREQIIQSMRQSEGLENSPNLVAYWKFDDPNEKDGLITQAKDYTGNGNDLDLRVLPTSSLVYIKKFSTNALEFANSYAIKSDVINMPDKDITVEFWARTRALNATSTAEEFAEFFSFASVKPGQGKVDDQYGPDLGFIDDAIVIEKYMSEFNGRIEYFGSDVDTKGSISVHINANREGNGLMYDHWIDFKCDWLDDEWHHIAATWTYETGVVQLFFDGESKIPIWRSSANQMTDATPEEGGTQTDIAARTRRSTNGSLALGQQQETFGGGFSPFYAFNGQMAVLRVWNRVLSEREVRDNMFRIRPTNDDGLVMMYDFEDTTGNMVKDLIGSNDLKLGAPGPQFMLSTAPLTDKNGKDVPTPDPSSAGYAMRFHDMQVLSTVKFDDFPTTAITVEFWMLSYDNCRRGVPFSYATGDYKNGDNSFLIFNYNNWGVSVMEDEGNSYDHEAGIGAADGLWHHIAVTWQSKDGAVQLYQDGRLVWRVARAKGLKIEQGGSLVIGREQDCQLGCFDSASGSVGNIETGDSAQYGSQDFFGFIDEMKIWKRVLTHDEINKNILADKEAFSAEGRGTQSGSRIPQTSDLVAYWDFNKGQGYVVKDVTGNGHDLYAAEKVDWVPVVWNSLCGNSAIESGEVCDDGNTIDGDGCDHNCMIEPFWKCEGEPSDCHPSSIFDQIFPDLFNQVLGLDDTPDDSQPISFLAPSFAPSPSPAPTSTPTPSPTPRPNPQPERPIQFTSSPTVSSSYQRTESRDGVTTVTTSFDSNRGDSVQLQSVSGMSPSPYPSQESNKKSSGGGGVVVAIVIVLVVLVAVVVTMFVMRERLYQMFPRVKRVVQDINQGVQGYRTPAGPIGTSVAISPENKDIAAEFATASEYAPLRAEDIQKS